MLASRPFVLTLLLSGSLSAVASPAAHPIAEQQALELAQKAISFRSVNGPENQTQQVAELFKQALVAGGFAASDVVITPYKETSYLIARWHGRDPKLKPLVISGHMDVVEAKPADWQRDPFTPVIENGMLFGRGASDMKLDAALTVAAVIELKRAGYKPRRDIIVEFSGDEETDMETSELIAKELSNAEMVLNMDGTGGVLDKDGHPLYFNYQGAEKAFADFDLLVTNPGGHSSAPRDENAIYQLAAALLRIGAYKFTPELNDITRTYFTEAARYEDEKTGAAMRAFAADPTDAAAISTLRANSAMIGRTGTTCVATMVSGGHAYNALPQRATAAIDCRVFPGHSRQEIQAELERAVAAPMVQFTDVSGNSVATPASPLRTDVVSAVTKAIRLSYPAIPVFPTMSAGASDSQFFRHLNVPSYGISPLFIKASDHFSHGLNERIPVDNVKPSIVYLLSLVTDLSK
jgi:carboxypeptidase PM20D1